MNSFLFKGMLPYEFAMRTNDEKGSKMNITTSKDNQLHIKYEARVGKKIPQFTIDCLEFKKRLFATDNTGQCTSMQLEGFSGTLADLYKFLSTLCEK